MILSGTFSGTRHRVEGQAPPDAAKRFQTALARHAFAPIDPASDATRRLGWVNPRQILDTDLHWDKLLFGDALVLGLRIDTRRVSRPLLKARVQEAVDARRREKPGARVTREERANLARAVETEMLAQTPPNTAIQETAWDTRAGTLWFSSTAQKLNEEMADLFERTFGLRLVPLAPFPLAEAHTESRGRGGGALARVKPLDLRPRG